MQLSDKPFYDEALSIREALQIYFHYYGFKNGGYDAKWFKIRFTDSFAIPLPNIPARVEAVKLHDIHHIVTGYPATLKGEALIGAWEIGSGCGKFYAAWLLNYGAFVYGLWFWPREIYHAFKRGLLSENLYHGTKYDEKLLSSSVGTVKAHLLKRRAGLSMKQMLTFVLWLSAALISTALILIIAIIITSLLLKLLK